MSIRKALLALIGEDPPPAPRPIATTMSPPTKRPRWYKSRLLGTTAVLALSAAAVSFVLLNGRPPKSSDPPATQTRAPRVGSVVGTEAPPATPAAMAVPAVVPPPAPNAPPPARTLDAGAYAQEMIGIGGKGAGGRGRPGEAGAAGEGGPAEPGSEMDAALRVGRTPTARARRVDNAHLKMRPNTPIECAMDNVTDNGTGFVSGSCTVTQSAYSMTGTVALIPKNSTITIRGERSGNAGDTRIMLSAATAIVKYDGIPEPMEIDIMAAVADALGATGVQGRRDARTWERIKASVLLGISGEAGGWTGRYLASEGLPGGQTARTAATAGTRGLRYATQIPVHVTVRQGEAIAVVLQGYADFSSQLELVEIR